MMLLDAMFRRFEGLGFAKTKKLERTSRGRNWVPSRLRWVEVGSPESEYTSPGWKGVIFRRLPKRNKSVSARQWKKAIKAHRRTLALA